MTARCESGARERAALSPASPHRSREGRGSRVPAPTPQPWPHARRLPCRRAPHSPSRRRCRGPSLGRRSEHRQRRRAGRTRLPMQGGRGAQCLGRSVSRGGDSRYGCPCHPVHRVDGRGRGGLTDLADRGGRPGRRPRLSTDVGSSPEGGGGGATSVGQGVPPAACTRRCSHGRWQEGPLAAATAANGRDRAASRSRSRSAVADAAAAPARWRTSPRTAAGAATLTGATACHAATEYLATRIPHGEATCPTSPTAGESGASLHSRQQRL